MHKTFIATSHPRPSQQRPDQQLSGLQQISGPRHSSQRVTGVATALGWIVGAACVLGYIPCLGQAVEGRQQTPNVVFILADDLGYGDVHCFGQERCKIETPNLDQLAADGIRFTNAHVNASVCMPTRLAIMTGRYPWRFVPHSRGGPWGFVGLSMPPDTFTLGDMFRSAGYTTSYIGKWHLGTKMATKDGASIQDSATTDFTRPLRIGPPEFGFDDSFILPGSLDMFPYAFAENNRWLGSVTAQKGWSAFNRIGPAEEEFEDHLVLETFYRRAEHFLSQQTREQPFFLYLALTAPHTPVSPGANFQGKSAVGVYGDFVMEVDHAVQRVREALKTSQLADNTLIVFSSDHGPASYAGNILQATPGQIHALEEGGHYPSGPFRGYKFSVYEGGLRVPTIACWPGRAPAGKSCDQLIGMCDLMATFAEVAEHPLASDQGVDSISFLRLLKNPSQPGLRTELVQQSTGPFVVRRGKWKLCLCPGSGASGKYGNQPAEGEAWRRVLPGGAGPLSIEDLAAPPFVQLFDLSNDPHEDHNVADNNPELVQQMIELLRSQIARGRSTPGEQLSNDRANIPLFPRLPGFVRQRLDLPRP